MGKLHEGGGGALLPAFCLGRPRRFKKWGQVSHFFRWPPYFYINEKIEKRMDQLQDWMESNHHLEHPDDVIEHISTVSKFWRALSEEDRDYIEGCRLAIGKQMEWNIPEENKRINRVKIENEI